MAAASRMPYNPKVRKISHSKRALAAKAMPMGTSPAGSIQHHRVASPPCPLPLLAAACSAKRVKKNDPKMNTTMNVVSLTANPAASKKPNTAGNRSRGRSMNRTITTIIARVKNAVSESSRPSRVM